MSTAAETGKPGSPVTVARLRALKLMKMLFLPIAIAALLYVGWQARVELRQIVVNARPELLLAAVFLWTLMHLIAPLFSRAVFKARGHTLSYRTAAEIHNANLPARYLPGGIWHSVGRVLGFRDHGIGRRDLAVFVFLENALALTLAGLMGCCLLLYTRGLEGWGMAALFGAVASLLVLIAIPRILKSRFLDGSANVPGAALVNSALLVAVSWGIAASAFVCFYLSFPAAPMSASILDVAGTYLVSWAVGFAALFSPQGLGVFEFTAAELLRSGPSIGATAALLAGFRLVILAADAIVWTVSRLVPRSDGFTGR